MVERGIIAHEMLHKTNESSERHEPYLSWGNKLANASNVYMPCNLMKTRYILMKIIYFTFLLIFF